MTNGPVLSQLRDGIAKGLPRSLEVLRREAIRRSSHARTSFNRPRTASGAVDCGVRLA